MKDWCLEAQPFTVFVRPHLQAPFPPPHEPFQEGFDQYFQAPQLTHHIDQVRPMLISNFPRGKLKNEKGSWGLDLGGEDIDAKRKGNGPLR